MAFPVLKRSLLKNYSKILKIILDNIIYNVDNICRLIIK